MTIRDNLGASRGAPVGYANPVLPTRARAATRSALSSGRRDLAIRAVAAWSRGEYRRALALSGAAIRWAPAPRGAPRDRVTIRDNPAPPRVAPRDTVTSSATPDAPRVAPGAPMTLSAVSPSLLAATGLAGAGASLLALVVAIVVALVIGACAVVALDTLGDRGAAWRCEVSAWDREEREAHVAARLPIGPRRAAILRRVAPVDTWSAALDTWTAREAWDASRIDLAWQRG